MKIKYLGFTSFSLAIDSVELLTDPTLSEKNGISLKGTQADIVLSTDKTEKTSIKGKNREDVFVISKPGEYEVSGLMIQKGIDSQFYSIDSDLIRVVYIGSGSANLDIKSFKDIGDVDVLLLPIGGGEMFPDYDLLEKIISEVDPIKLVPFAYGGDLKSLEDFIKHFGYIYTQESMLKLDSAPEQEERKMDVVVLNS